MLITRRSDYSLRILRMLRDGELHNVREICDEEEIPTAFAYKILRELEQMGLVRSQRGNRGGYVLQRPLEELTLYDVVCLTEGGIDLLHCMKEDCERNPEDMPCKVHKEVARIQDILAVEMQRYTLAEIMDD